MEKVHIIPTSSFGGHKCFAFVNKKHRQAFKDLTGNGAVSVAKMKSLKVLGVDVELSLEDTPPTDAQ